MPVTLEQARQNAADDMDLAVIDEFRTSRLIDRIVFDDVINPLGGGGTLTYGYRRVKTLSNAGFRAINAEYAPTEATTEQHSVELKPLGGSYQLDRVLARVGPAASGENAFQMRQKIRATQAEFAQAFVNGDSAQNPDAFDGLSKALAGSSTETDGSGVDWSVTMDEAASFGVLDTLDALMGLLDGPPTFVMGNSAVIGRLRSAARRTGVYTEAPSPVPGGQDTFRYGTVEFIDPGKRAGSNADIIPLVNGTSDLYAVRIGLDGLHGVSMAGAPLVQSWLPNFNTPGAVKTGEVEMGPVALALKATRAAAVLRGVRVRPAA